MAASWIDLGRGVRLIPRLSYGHIFPDHTATSGAYDLHGASQGNFMSYYPEATSLVIEPASELWDANSARVFERLAATFAAATNMGVEHPQYAQSSTNE